LRLQQRHARGFQRCFLRTRNQRIERQGIELSNKTHAVQLNKEASVVEKAAGMRLASTRGRGRIACVSLWEIPTQQHTAGYAGHSSSHEKASGFWPEAGWVKK
jgi:hypothetical protein